MNHDHHCLGDAIATAAVDVLPYAVMSNHLHLVVRTDPQRVPDWSNDDVVRRWALAHPRIGRDDGEPVAWSDAEIAARADDAAWVAKTRPRLRSLSWFMKSIKERLARRANRADGCTGHFWEGRFQYVPLLDHAAVIACMALIARRGDPAQRPRLQRSPPPPRAAPGARLAPPLRGAACHP